MLNPILHKSVPWVFRTFSNALAVEKKFVYFQCNQQIPPIFREKFETFPPVKIKNTLCLLGHRSIHGKVSWRKQRVDWISETFIIDFLPYIRNSHLKTLEILPQSWARAHTKASLCSVQSIEMLQQPDQYAVNAWKEGDENRFSRVLAEIKSFWLKFRTDIKECVIAGMQRQKLWMMRQYTRSVTANFPRSWTS